MDLLEIIGIAAVLATDASLYVFSCALLVKQHRLAVALRLACAVALFQALMPLLGYGAGMPLHATLLQWESYFVMFIFLCLGGSAIVQAWRPSGAPVTRRSLRRSSVLLMSLLTSVDAFAMGACVPLSHMAGISTVGQMLGACLVIGLVTFILALCAFAASNFLSRLPSRFLETLAGLIMIALGLSYGLS